MEKTHEKYTDMANNGFWEYYSLYYNLSYNNPVVTMQP